MGVFSKIPDVWPASESTMDFMSRVDSGDCRGAYRLLREEGVTIHLACLEDVCLLAARSFNSSPSEASFLLKRAMASTYGLRSSIGSMGLPLATLCSSPRVPEPLFSLCCSIFPDPWSQTSTGVSPGSCALSSGSAEAVRLVFRERPLGDASNDVPAALAEHSRAGALEHPLHKARRGEQAKGLVKALSSGSVMEVERLLDHGARTVEADALMGGRGAFLRSMCGSSWFLGAQACAEASDLSSSEIWEIACSSSCSGVTGRGLYDMYVLAGGSAGSALVKARRAGNAELQRLAKDFCGFRPI